MKQYPNHDRKIEKSRKEKKKITSNLTNEQNQPKQETLQKTGSQTPHN